MLKIDRNTFKNKSLKEIVKDPKVNDFEFKKSYVSGYSILVIHSENSMSSLTYYQDEKSRDEDFETIENLLQNGNT